MTLKLKVGVSADGDPCVGFEHEDFFISQPYESECGRFAASHVCYECPDDLAYAMTVVNCYLKEGVK